MTTSSREAVKQQATMAEGAESVDALMPVSSMTSVTSYSSLDEASSPFSNFRYIMQ